MAEVDPAEGATESVPNEAAFESGSVLIVDDNEDLCFALSVYFENLGYRVSTATSAMFALDILDQTSFDMLIIDCVMPPGTLTGAALGRMVRNRDRRAAIVFISGHEDVVEKEDLPGPIVTKPFHPEELHSVVSKMLSGRAN
jgi:DNA-binding response OmpR family regulator